MGTKVLSNQRVTVLGGLASAIDDWKAGATLAELQGLTNVSGAVNWDAFDLNIEASEQNDDRTLTDGAGAQSRGFTNFGGGLQFVHPRVDDNSSVYRTAYNLFSTARVDVVVAVRYGKLNSSPVAAGDRFTVYRLKTDALSFGANDVSRFWAVNLLAQDDILVNYIVPASSPAAITATLVSNTASVSDLVFASAAYQGWDVTKEVTWVSSDEGKLVQVHPGIFQALDTGAPTLVAKYPGATDSVAATVTIS